MPYIGKEPRKDGGSLTLGATLDTNGNEIVLDADADTSITADTDDQIDIRIAGADDFQFTANTFTAQSGSTIAAQALTATTITATGAFTSLGIDDNANATSITIDSDENVGIKTTTPSNQYADDLVVSVPDDGGITIHSGAGTHAGTFAFSDATSGAGTYAGYITYDHNTNGMLFGTASGTKFTLADTGSTNVLTNANNTYVSRTNNTVGSGNVFMHLWRMTTTPNDDTSSFLLCDDGDGSNEKMRINSNGNVKNANNSYGSTSDERVKQNITDANSQWDDIKALKVRNFKKKDAVRQYGTDKAPIHLGLVAQELEAVSPKLVDELPPSVGDILSSSEFGTIEDDLENPIYYVDGDEIPNGKEIGDVKEYTKKVKEEKAKVKAIKYSILYMKAVKALQEAMTRIETLESKVKALEDA